MGDNYGFLSALNTATGGKYSDQLFGMLRPTNGSSGLGSLFGSSGNGNSGGLASLLGGGQQSLSPFQVANGQDPSWWHYLTGYSQNGQNFAGYGGAIMNGAIGGAQAYMNYQAYKAQRDLARDQFNLQKEQFEDSKKRYWDKWDRNNAARDSAMS